jgi:hypothetical protein
MWTGDASGCLNEKTAGAYAEILESLIIQINWVKNLGYRAFSRSTQNP